MFKKLFLLIHPLRFIFDFCLLLIVCEIKQRSFDVYHYLLHLGKAILYEALHWMLVKALL